MKKYHWINNKTGEVVTNIWQVIKTTIHDGLHYKGVEFEWKYSKEGY